MKLAFSTNAYLKFSFAEAVKRLAKIGYAGVEIMADVPHAWPACLLEEQKQAIRQALKENRLEISNINAFMMNAISDARSALQAGAHRPYEAGPDYGARAGGQVYHHGTGWPSGCWRVLESGP